MQKFCHPMFNHSQNPNLTPGDNKKHLIVSGPKLNSSLFRSFRIDVFSDLAGLVSTWPMLVWHSSATDYWQMKPHIGGSFTTAAEHKLRF